MKLPIRLLSISLVVVTMTGMSACKNTTDIPSEISLPKKGETVDARSIQSAVADWTKSVEPDQKSAKGFIVKGSIKYAMGDQNGAITDYTKSIALDPESIAAYSDRATARFSTGDISGSVPDALEAAKLMVLSKIETGNGVVE